MKLKKRVFLFILLLLARDTQAQIEDPPPPVQINHELEAGYRDSVRTHENTDLHYRPHCCQNRYGKYGWVGKHHQVFIPFEYDFFQSFAKLSDFNIARKGKFYGALDAQGRVILPFKYTGVTPLDQQELVICANGAYKKTVLNFQGQVIMPEDSLYQIWLFNDTSLAVQDFKQKNTRICDIRGKVIKIWNYRQYVLFYRPAG
jgi:hypothetical protein